MDISIDKNSISIDEMEAVANEIFTARKDDFYKIKNETGIKKFLHAITFNADAKKYMLKDISSLAKLQELFMRVYKKNYETSHEQLDRVMKSLMDTNEKLLKLYKRIDKKITVTESPADLCDYDKELLELFLKICGSQMDEVTSSVQAYNRGVKRAIGNITAEGTLDDHELQKLENPKVIYRCYLEQAALAGTLNSCEWTDYVYSLLSDIELGENTKRKIRESVDAEIYSYGAEYFIQKYGEESYLMDDIELVEVASQQVSVYSECRTKDGVEHRETEIILGESIDADDEVSSKNRKEFGERADVEILSDDSADLSEYIMPGHVRIESGERVKIKGRTIHLNSFIDIAGEVFAEDCLFYYNEGSDRCQINIVNKSSISLDNCKVICCGNNGEYLIRSEKNGDNCDNGTIEIRNCTFVDCNHLMYIKSEFEIGIVNCYIKNCGTNLIDIYNPGTMDVSISQSLFEWEEMKDFNISDKKIEVITSFDDYDINNIINCKATISRCYFRQKAKFNMYKIPITCIESKYSQVNNCLIEGFTGGWSFCVRIMYDNIIRNTTSQVRVIAHDKESAKISHCLFEKCDNPIYVFNDSCLIEYSQFIDCTNRIIQGCVSGGTEVNNCDFINIKVTEVNAGTWACLEFDRTKDGQENTVRNCAFKGADLNDGYLFAARCFEKPKGIILNIEDCSFVNCNTKCESLYNEYTFYYGLFDIHINVWATNIKGCTGIRDKNGSGSVSQSEYSIMHRGSDGEDIGTGIPVEELLKYAGCSL